MDNAAAAHATGLDDEQTELNGGDEEEGFRYPESENGSPNDEEEGPATESDEEFKYPAVESEAAAPEIISEPGHSTPPPPEPEPQSQLETPLPAAVPVSPAQLEAMYAASLDGNISLLKSLVGEATSSGELEAFALVNDASPRTGLTVVHAAASRGHVKTLKWCTLMLSIARQGLFCLIKGY